MEATFPYVLKCYKLQRTIICASFELIFHIFTQIITYHKIFQTLQLTLLLSILNLNPALGSNICHNLNNVEPT